MPWSFSALVTVPALTPSSRAIRVAGLDAYSRANESAPGVPSNVT